MDDSTGGLDPFCYIAGDYIHDPNEHKDGCESKHSLDENLASTIAIDDNP